MKRIFALVLLVFTILPSFSQNILMIGDSHTRGSILPLTIKENITKKNSFNYDGKNGYTLKKYTDRCLNSNWIKKNDIIIVEFGTNESYLSYNETTHKKALSQFYKKAKLFNPKIKIIFISPIPNRIKIKGVVVPNKNVDKASITIRNFVRNNTNCYFVNAPLLEQKYYQKDNVHLTVKGYQKLGNIVSKDINFLINEIFIK